MKIETANGKEGCLIYCGSGEYCFRIYKTAGTFKDYKMRHSDMWLKINDEDVYLYEDGDEAWIDHSPATLGLENKE